MRWSEIMPLHSGEILDGEDPFPVDEIFNPISDPVHILSVSLFNTRGITGIDAITSLYLNKILTGAELLKKKHERLAVRVYLAADLAEFVQLLSNNCEVYLMKHSSSNSCPGMIWRHLALDGARCPVTIMDAEEVINAGNRMAYTEALMGSDCSFWRIPVPVDFKGNLVFYKTIAGCCFGGVKPVPVRGIFRSFWREYTDGTLPTEIIYPRNLIKYKLFGASWPSYGFDEFFLNAAIYPYFCREGCIAVIGDIGKSCLFPIDVEFAALLNPANCQDFIHFKELSTRSAVRSRILKEGLRKEE